MRAKTIQRLGILIAILGIIGGTAIWAHKYQLSKMSSYVATKAQLAEQNGDFAEAERLYQQHVEVLSDDAETNIKYADMLSKSGTLNKQQEALALYNDILKLKRLRGRYDLVRKRVDLEVKLKRFSDARSDLLILLDGAKDDGELWFLMGKCSEAEKDEATAQRSYDNAIKSKNRAPEYLEAYQRLASLLRKKPGQEKQADQLIEQMVSSEPHNYKVYLERGRYRSAQAQAEGEPGSYRDVQTQQEAERKRSQLLEAACSDLRKAAELAPYVPEVVVELAKAVNAGKSGRTEARLILEKGLKAAPQSVELYEALATLELQDGHSDKAVETLERGLEARRDSVNLHLILADVLARGGDTGKLRLHIEELRKLGLHSRYIQYFMAYYYVNLHQCEKARQVLIPLLAETGPRHPLAVPINLLLARCYSELGETQMQQDAYSRAFFSDSGDVRLKLEYIQTQIRQGDLDGAIKGYRELKEKVSQVRLPFAELLIARNRQRAASEQEWMEVERLIEDAAKAAPESVTPVLLRADMMLARDRTKIAEARELIQKARKRFPKNVELWNAEARILSGLWEPQANPFGKDRKVEEALAFLNEAERQLGDSVELRLQRARLWTAKTGSEVTPALNELAQKADAFSKPDRRKLLNGLAEQLVRRQDLEGASRLWSQLAEDDPDDIGLRRNLLELAFQIGNKDEIEKNIKQIERIEGREGIQARYWNVQYLIWQIARTGDDKIRQEKRAQARASLSELRLRRPDWPVIPVRLAELDEQELRDEKDLNNEQKREKQQSIVNAYIEAIDLGEHGSAVVRKVVQLLFDLGKADEALALFNRISAESPLAGDLARRLGEAAFEHQDFRRAEEIARKTVATNPDSFQDRWWLVLILWASGDQAAAEQELKKAVELGKDDPDRWFRLVRYMLITRQPEKAEQAIQEAEKNLPRAKAPLALAQYCKLMGDAFQDVKNEAAKAKWYEEAEKWYEKDRVAKPNDLVSTRRLVDFFIETKQLGKAESLLNTVLKQNSGKSSDFAVWATRMLALTRAAGADPTRLKEALSLDDPADLRLLVQVLEAQRTPEHRQRAIQVLQSLVDKNVATDEDRFLLARLTAASGDWPAARKFYRDLIVRTDKGRGLETFSRRPAYLFQFASDLLEHCRAEKDHRAGNKEDLVEAENVIGKLRKLQPDSFDVLALEVEGYKLQDQVDRAVELIAGFANRSSLPQGIYRLAQMAERLDRPKVAERLYKEIISRWPNLSQGAVWLAGFLGRRGQVKEALDLLEPLWANATNPGLLAMESMKVVLGASVTQNPSSQDPTQISRVSGWLERALAKNPKSEILALDLGNIREQQGLYAEAEELYKQAVTNGTRGGVACNNLAWLMTLYDGKATAALEYINQAIELGGPTSDFLDTRSVIYLALGDNQKAIKDLEGAIKDLESTAKADPAASAKLFHLAQAYLAAHDKEKAKRAFEAAKAKGLVASKLHRLEEPVYRNIVKELGMK